LAAPVGACETSTSTVLEARTSPRQQANIVVAGRPGINSWIVIFEAARLCHAHKAKKWRLIRNRFHAIQAFIVLGAEWKLWFASVRERTIVTPSPPQVPSSFRTAGLSNFQSFNSSAELIVRVNGTRIPRLCATCKTSPLCRIAGYASAAPRESSIKGRRSASLACSACNCQTAMSSQGTMSVGCAARIAAWSKSIDARP
jgi:hypothetical protein